MTLYIISPIPIRSRCFLKAIIHRKNSGLFYITWESFCFLSRQRFLWYCTGMLYLTNFSILSRFVSIFCYFIYRLSIIWSHSTIIHLIFIRLRNVLLLKHHLIWYIWCHIIFYLVHVIYCLYLTKIYLFISIPYPKSMINKEKTTTQFPVVICVCCMSSSKIFLSQDGVFQNSTGCNKKMFLWPTMVATFGKHYSLISQLWENVISFHFLANALRLQHF